MSIVGIASTALSQLSNLQRNQQTQGGFARLAQDLQTGNLGQAQADFVSLSQSVTGNVQTGGGFLAQAFSSLGQALQSNNLTAAQQAFATLQQGLQQSSAVHHHHAHAGQQTDNISPALSQLQQALASGNLTAAQQAFSAVQQSWQQFGKTGVLADPPVPPSSSRINVTA